MRYREDRTLSFTAKREQGRRSFGQYHQDAGRHAKRCHEWRRPNSEQGTDATGPNDAADAKEAMEA